MARLAFADKRRTRPAGSSKRAAVSKGLLILLGLVVAGCAAYWVFRSGGDEIGAAVTESTIYCSKCGPIKVTSDQLKKIEWDAQNRLKCPTCGDFKASFTQGGHALDVVNNKP